MSIFHKSLSNWSIADVNLLIESETEESQFLDYKRDLPDKSDGKKKEFLYDICSFANASGGLIVYGISEKIVEGSKTNKPGAIEGISTDPSEELNRLNQIISAGITPRINGIESKILRFENSWVLIYRINKSWNSPHMVSLEGINKFYTRNQTGKVLMDYNQIQSSFINGEQLTKRSTSFCNERADLIGKGVTPIPLLGTRRLIIHILPLGAFHNQTFSIQTLKSDNNNLMPINAQFNNPYTKINLDGICRYENHKHNYGYVQVFRSGIHEFVDGYVIDPNANNDFTFVDAIGSAISQSLDSSFKNIERLGIFDPVVVQIQLQSVRNRKLYYSSRGSIDERHFDRDTVFIPNIVIEDRKWETRMGDLMDPICQSAGYEKCHYIQADGTYKVDKTPQ
ncbi:helix-turn-helix domain-containing protein [Bdellovibrio sp. HCB274]|uniref:AlbA family DNA-binding domain-containing protein n=1 Tax=Bdellovibrio sp. HCB274 TaxID=3394361 RepID=UPI0039B6506A